MGLVARLRSLRQPERSGALVTREDAIANIAEAGERALEQRAAYHKQQRDYHRRENARAMEDLRRFRERLSEFGITYEPEANSHGRTNPRT